MAVEWCHLAPRLLATASLHLCHTRQCHAKTPVSKNRKHRVYIMINVALKHLTGISRSRTDTLACFSARDLSFRKLLARQRESKQGDRNHESKGGFRTNYLKQTVLWKRPFHPLQRSLIALLGVRLWGAYQDIKARAMFLVQMCSFSLSVITLWWAQQLYLQLKFILWGRMCIAEPHQLFQSKNSTKRKS